MAKNQGIIRRQNGVYYTPTELSTRLVKQILADIKPAKIFDPACGEGSLLEAANKVLRNDNTIKRFELYGCDISPNLKKLSNLRLKKVWENDFIEQKFNQQFDLILMNPPYVRHHAIPRKLKTIYNDSVNETCPLPKSADLWAYFLVKSIELMAPEGCLAAILPWAFLQADYARIIRAWIADRFKNIEITTVSSKQFEHANERIALVWFKNMGQPVQSITIRNVEKPFEDVPAIHLKWSDWMRSRVLNTKSGAVDDVISEMLNKGFIYFREVADIKIGTVTGADHFFIAEKKTAKQLGLKSDDCQDIINSLKNFRGLSLNGHGHDKVLMHFSPKTRKSKLVEYIKSGEEEKIHLRAHCTRRNPWYSIRKPTPPDAFFPYRAIHTPYIVINKSGSLCTNSIHAINWRKLLKRQIEWVQVSMLSVFGQLSIEAYAKTYGSGVLKIEPGALKNMIVVKGIKQLPKGIYSQINKLIKGNDRLAASELATEVVLSSYSISDDTVNLCNKMLEELKQRRLN